MYTPKFSDVLSIPSNPEDLFTLLYPIGNGGFGKVYKARHKSSNQIFAIKILDFTKGCNNDKKNISFNYKSILQETSLMRLINESNYIIKYYGSYYSHQSNTIWLILEYCSSGSAVDLMLSMGRTLSEVEIATIMEMVLKGLDLIHKINLIHRDIKGANILLSEDGYAKLGDFGVGIQMTDEEFRTSKKGSPYWMSPQVILNRNYDTKTDIWSLGITCLELAEGEPPYGDLKPEEVMEKIAKKPPKAGDIIDVREHTEDFINFVNRCLEINPKKRPSADILIKDPFIQKLARGKEYLSNLIKQHISEVEKFRYDKEQFMNNKEKEENEEMNFNENKILEENKEYNLNSVESISLHQNTNSFGNTNDNEIEKKSSNGLASYENENKDYIYIDNNNNQSDNIIINGKNKYNSNIANKSRNCEDESINEDFDNNYIIMSKEIKKYSPNNLMNNDIEKIDNLYSYTNYKESIIENINCLNHSNTNSNINSNINSNNINKNISILTNNNESNDINDINYTFKKSKDNKYEINKSLTSNKNENENLKNFGIKKKITGVPKKKILLYNNTNSNGGAISKNNENINESDDDDKIKPINHCILNANYENNKLENTYDNIRLSNLDLNLGNNNTAKNSKIAKRNIKIPPLNLVSILNNDNDIKSADLNTHDSPTHNSSFSLFKTHQKYFK